jgi:triacylglycerol esterase/lipase EstA (alpha/beta hydrolase family)
MSPSSHSVARISGFTFLFVGAALLLGSVYGLIHSTFHAAALWCLGVAIICGTLGLIQIANRMADYLPASMATVIHWIHAMVFETFAMLVVVVLRPTHYFPSHRVAAGPLTGRPILLVHGYLHDSSAWMYLKRKWLQKGLGPIYCMNLGYPFRSIRDYAEQVRQKAEQIAKETGRSDLILIGHSMGGLVVSWYATHLAQDDTIMDVITIGSPLKGTRVAQIGLGQDAREMEIGSPFLIELHEAIENHPSIRFYHIGTQTDQLVIPHTSTLLAGHPDKQFVVKDIGHLTLLFSPRIAQVVATWVLSSKNGGTFSFNRNLDPEIARVDRH